MDCGYERKYSLWFFKAWLTLEVRTDIIVNDEVIKQAIR